MLSNIETDAGGGKCSGEGYFVFVQNHYGFSREEDPTVLSTVFLSDAEYMFSDEVHDVVGMWVSFGGTYTIADKSAVSITRIEHFEAID